MLRSSSVVVRIFAETAKPRDDRPCDGIFTIALELTAMGSPAWENGRYVELRMICHCEMQADGLNCSQVDLEPYVTRILDKVIRRSNALDTESLCIVRGVSCWSIRADVHVLDYDGNLIDSACIGIMAGLQHFRRPDAVVKDGQVTVYGLDERVPVPLHITHKPIAITFHTFNEGKLFVLDANRKEEQAAEGDIVIALNNAGTVCHFSKVSGHPVSAMELVSKSTVALDKVKEINSIIDKALEADLAKRAKSGLGVESSAQNDR